MNCSPRGRACHQARHDEAEQPADETMTAIAQVLASSLKDIPITFYNAGGDRPHPLFELTRDTAVIFEGPGGIGRLVPGATELTIDGKRASMAVLDEIEWIKPIPIGNLYQGGGTIDTSEQRKQIGDMAGLKIFADPRVPSREIWMGVDMSKGPDITGYFDADGNIHIIIPGETL